LWIVRVSETVQDYGSQQMMNLNIRNTSLMMVFLLEECNFACPHCVRGDEPMARGYRLTFRELKACLADCRELKAVSWVHFSGGEPTLWEEAGRDLVDLLLAISDAGLIPGFTSNGSAFLDYDACDRFFRRYVGASSTPLRLYLSIDTFHQNFDPDTGRALSLDNVLRWRQSLPEDKATRLETNVLVTVSKEPSSLLPEAMVEHYESLGADFSFIPLRFKGRAKALGDICPVLDTGDPEDLGAYARFYRSQTLGQAAEGPEREGASNLVLIGDTYYIFREGTDHLTGKWLRVGNLGALPDAIVRQYSDTRTA
jgi:MoaA/NifB/PqqE/SkfB family radical SAM enzyme